MKGLTEKQQDILDFLINCVQEEHYTPTVREIAAQFRIKSTNAVRNHLEALERKGCLSRRAGESRGIELASEYFDAPVGIPLVGRVAAGCPITALENIDGYLSFDNLFKPAERLYALQVHGDSMIDAGIWDQDYVIVREQPELSDGEIGVAIIDEEATVKRIKRRGSFIDLIPANDNYQVLRVNLELVDFRIGGKVVGVHRIVK